MTRFRTLIRSDESGFTLVEVLVSLVIFSVAILGLTQAGTQTVATLNQLEQRTYASIIADNQLALARLRTETTSSQTQSGQAQSGGRDFEYRIRRLETEVENFFELVVSVNAVDSEQILIERRAFVTKSGS
jgi:general secretion pathway protein I